MARTQLVLRRRFVFAFTIPLCLSVFLGGPATSARGAEPPADVQAALDAGEFGPALAAAGAVNDAAARDQLLGTIAAAQAGAGARGASLETAASISNDLARKAALDRMSAGGNFPGDPRGGGIIADFDSLIDLITTTVSPETWEEVGGPGTIMEFAGGVYVDSVGLLRKLPPQTDRSLVAVRSRAISPVYSGDPRRNSALRKISLTRLEREVQLLHAQGRGPDEAMQTLAGLQRIQYVLIYPETGDIVLAGPAGDWRRDIEGRYVSADKGQPVVRLDDLVDLIRNALRDDGRFGCSITPRKENLAKAQQVNDRWSRQPLRASQRPQWLAEFKEAVGRQDIEVYGIDPRTRTARVIVEADYRMKLVGLGLEEGTLGVESYLSSITLGEDGKPPPMNVLRWWFTLNYGALTATETRDAFALNGSGVKVLSENEWLNERGERSHTGKSDEPSRRFAESFTKHFELLAGKYPIYAELRNVFDLALVASLVSSHDLPGQVGWHLTHFGPDGDYAPELATAPKEVESVMNHRVIGGRHVVAAVSGGVVVDARTLTAPPAVKTDTYGLLPAERQQSAPQALPRRAWWWD
jgi:hypothetical protein